MKQVLIQKPLIYKQLALETPLPEQSRLLNGERDNKELFLTLHEVQLNASKLKECCIFICGDTRTGKSTLHNCIVNPNVLVGQEEGLNNYYVLRDSNNPEVAKIGSSLTSVTMMPNVSILNAQTTIVDLPGMGERGKGVEVIKVNFINGTFFFAPKKAKFIVVFTQGALKDIDNGGFKDTLNNFLAFFDSQHFFSVEEKRQLFSSVAFCFTSVDFKRKPYEKVKEKYLTQLLVMLDKLEKWHQAKPSQMPTFPLAKQLVKAIVAQKRIQLFELAVEGQSPPHNKFLQAFDKCNWRFLKIREKIDKIVFPYDKQYQALDQEQKKLVDKIIEQRFSLCSTMRQIIGRMLQKVIRQIGKKTINIDEQLTQMQDILKKLPSYGNKKQQFQVPQLYTIDQRLHFFQKLDEVANRMMNLDTWKKKNSLSPDSEYYTIYLTRMFVDQITLIKRLFSYSPAATDMLKRLQDNIYKMLAQAAIFAYLSSKYQSSFKLKFAEEISFGAEIGGIGIGTIPQIKQKFVQYFQNSKLQMQDYKTEDLKRIIKVLVQLKGQLKELNPTVFYGISSKLKQMLASIYRSNKMTTQYVEQIYSTLIEAVKSHICLALIPLSSTEKDLMQLIGLERNILKQAEQIFNSERNKNRINGNLQLKLAFQSLLSCKDRDEFKSMVKSIFMILADFMRAEFKNVNLTKEQMLPPITVSSNANNEAEIHFILSQYYNLMKNQINEENVEIRTPPTYSLSNQAQVYQAIKERVKNKQVIFVFGENLGGKSVVIEVLKRKKMYFDKNGCFDLIKPSRLSKINHTNVPSRFPNVTPLDENELFVEIPSYHDISSQQKYIKMSLLLDLIMSINKFRIIWVVTETTLKGKVFENSIAQIIRLLPDSKKSKQVKESVFTLIVNRLNTDKTVCRKYLESHIESLNTVDKKVAKYLSSILFTNRMICQDMTKCEFIANDFQSLKALYLESSRLAITHEGLFTKFIPDKDFLIKLILDKIRLVKDTLNPLIGLTNDSLSEFLEGTRISDKNWFYNDIVKCLEEPILKGYQVDISALPKYEATVGLIENRPFIYHQAIQLKKSALVLDSQYEFNLTYQKYEHFMDHFFNNMASLCCINKQQYTNFMKLRIVLAILLKELEYYSLIFKDVEHQDYKLQLLSGQLRFRDMQDRMTNFTEMSEEELMQKLMNQASKWKENQLRSYIELLIFFIKTTKAVTPVKIAVMIELLIFMLKLKPNKNFVMNWDKDLTEKKLIDSIFNYSFVQKNSSKNLLAFGKLQQQASEKTLSELTALKMKLIA